MRQLEEYKQYWQNGVLAVSYMCYVDEDHILGMQYSRHGKGKSYYDNKNIYCEFEYNNGKQINRETYYRKNGEIWRISHYNRNGNRFGEILFFLIS